MNEMTAAEIRSMKKKSVIKNIAIVFLVILLLLTFFSQTIMNYSLPEVATQMIESGTVSPQIRGTGTIEADDPYEVIVYETRKIASVKAKVGDHVEKDDVLYELEEAESPDLKEAREKLEDLKQSYEMSLLRGDVPDDIIQRVQDGYTPDFNELREGLKVYTEKVDALDEQIKAIEDELTEMDIAQELASKVKDVENAKKEFDEEAMAYRLTEMSLLEAGYNLDISDLNESISDLEKQIANIEVSLEKATEGSKHYDNLLAKYTAAQRNLSSKKNEVSDLEDKMEAFTRERHYWDVVSAQKDHQETIERYTEGQSDAERELKIYQMNRQKNELTKQMDQAKEDKEEYLNNINREIELDASRKAVQDQEKELEKVTKNALGDTIKAPIAGTITSMSKVAGQNTSSQDVVAVMRPDGKDMVMSFSVTNDQAKNLKVGDVAEPQNAWYYNDFKASLKSITTDSTSPNSKKKLTFKVSSPDVQAGQSISLVIGQRSDRYDMTVPSSAIRESTDGKYILIIKSKSSPLGNRYIASKVLVEVLASDDTTSAISGSLEGYEYVITTSSIPVEAGSQVRLADN